MYLNRRVFVMSTKIEPAHDKTYNKACMTSKDLDQPVYPPSMSSVLAHSSLNSLEAV